MCHRQLLLCATAAAALSACSSTGDTPPPVPNQPGPTVQALNTTLGPISFTNPANGGAIDEVFDAVTASITVSQNADGGFEYVDQNMGDFQNISGTASFSRNGVNGLPNTLSFDIEQNDIDFEDTFGPIVLADPGDVIGIDNDDIAYFVAAFPEFFPVLSTDIPNNISAADAEERTFDPQAFFGDPTGADDRVNSLSRALTVQTVDANGDPVFDINGNPVMITLPAESDFVSALSDISAAIREQDFYRYDGVNGNTYFQLQTTGTNSGVTTNYVALGDWSAPVAAGAAGDTVHGTSIYGKLTPAGEIPDTGTARYDATAIGTLLRQNQLNGLRGGVTVDVNFQSRNVDFTYDAQVAASDVFGDTLFTPLTVMTGSGSIDGGNFFSGDLNAAGEPSLDGNFNGAFYGPSAAEIGGTLTFTSEDYAGSAAFVGTGNITTTAGN